MLSFKKCTKCFQMQYLQWHWLIAQISGRYAYSPTCKWWNTVTNGRTAKSKCLERFTLWSNSNTSLMEPSEIFCFCTANDTGCNIIQQSSAMKQLTIKEWKATIIRASYSFCHFTGPVGLGHFSGNQKDNPKGYCYSYCWSFPGGYFL